MVGFKLIDGWSIETKEREREDIEIEREESAIGWGGQLEGRGRAQTAAEIDQAMMDGGSDRERQAQQEQQITILHPVGVLRGKDCSDPMGQLCSQQMPSQLGPKPLPWIANPAFFNPLCHQ